jgi:hypothetical protein
LHRDARAVTDEWQVSARQTLEARFHRLAEASAQLDAEERAELEGRNVSALAAWGGVCVGPGGTNGSSSGDRGVEDGLAQLHDKAQALDHVLDGVWALSSPGGRYERVVAAFEAWTDRVAAVVESQQLHLLYADRGVATREGDKKKAEGEHVVLFLSELDDNGWKAERAGLNRKLDAWRRTLDVLGDVREAGQSQPPTCTASSNGNGDDDNNSSSLARILGGCRALVDGMLGELEFMGQIERDAARAEREWIDQANEELRVDGEADAEAATDVLLWRLAI